MQNFVQGDCNQPYLLPPDLRDWLPEDDLCGRGGGAGAVESVSGEQSRYGSVGAPVTGDGSFKGNS